MRFVWLLPCAALVAVWCAAGLLWPTLPERIPLHFDLRGVPDRHGARTVWNWLLPGIATLLVVAFTFALPPWNLRLAERDAPYLNVPRRAEFSRLAPEARVRALRPVAVLLPVLAAELALVFAWIQLASARVASGTWERLPTWMLAGTLAAIVATTVAFLLVQRRSLRQEIEARDQRERKRT